jgi:arylsulfatase A-like enzyme
MTSRVSRSRRFRGPCGIGLLLVLALAFASSAAARPNVVLIVTDDQRWDTLSAMPQVQRRLVEQGVTFTNALAVNPICCPSRATILTGRYSHSTGVYRNLPPYGGFASFRDGATIATRLDGLGYRTAYFGKYLNGYRDTAYVPPGWDHWVAFSKNGYYNYALNVNGAVENPSFRSAYSTDRLATEAVDFVRRTRGPFLMVFAPYAPHAPSVPARRHAGLFSELDPWRPPSYQEADVTDKPPWVRRRPLEPQRSVDVFRRHQLQSLRAVDDAVARLLRVLRGTGKLENTLVVFTSDNGYLWGEHRILGKGVAYEEAIRLPLVVRYDRLTRGIPREEPRLVANLDLAPTLARAAGAGLPGAEGRNLLPLIRGSDPSWRNALLVEYLGLPGKKPERTFCAIRTESSSYVVYASGARELYDLTADPYQLENRAGNPGFQARANGLRIRLGRLCNPPPPKLSRSLLCTTTAAARGGVLVGTRRYDIVCGRAGPDRIRPLGGRDWIYARRGNDVVFARDGLRDHIDCGRGRDRVEADAVDVVASCEVVRRGPGG